MKRVVEGVGYRAHTQALGDDPCVVFCYTDGVVEAMDAAGNQFGQERMTDALKGGYRTDPNALIRRMRKAITGFSGDAAQSDDITMIAMRLP